MSADEIYKLGTFYIAGKGLPKSKSRAFELWRRVLAQYPDHVETKFSLGTALLLSSPTEVTRDADSPQDMSDLPEDDSTTINSEGYRLLTEAVESGHAWAMANLAQFLLKQPSPNTSTLRRAVNLLSRSWDIGRVPIAPYNIYHILSSIAPGQSDSQAAETRAEAERWLRIGAVEIGDVTALYQLGCILQQRNDPEWVAFIRRAAEQGLAVAQHNLAVHLLQEKDYTDALRFFRAASNQGFIHSAFNLGLMYARGEGLSAADPASARVYLTQVLVSGDEDLKRQASFYLDSLR